MSEEVEVVGRKHAVVDDVGTVEGETVARTVRGGDGRGRTNGDGAGLEVAGGIEDGAAVVERRW